MSLNLRNILEVDEKAQFVSLETTLRMYWKDQRIKGNPLGGEDFVNVNGKAIELFWIPDIFIDQVGKNFGCPYEAPNFPLFMKRRLLSINL